MSSENISQVNEPFRPPVAPVATVPAKSVQGGKVSAEPVADPRAVIVKLQKAYARKPSVATSEINVQEIIKELQSTFYTPSGKITDDATAQMHLADAKTAMQTLQTLMSENKKIMQIRVQNPEIDRYFLQMQNELADGRLNEARNVFLSIVKNLHSLDTRSLLVNTLT